MVCYISLELERVGWCHAPYLALYWLQVENIPLMGSAKRLAILFRPPSAVILFEVSTIFETPVYTCYYHKTFVSLLKMSSVFPSYLASCSLTSSACTHAT